MAGTLAAAGLSFPGFFGGSTPFGDRQFCKTTFSVLDLGTWFLIAVSSMLFGVSGTPAIARSRGNVATPAIL